MKRSIALALFAATLISIGGATAHAQVAEFKVPFDFIVGNQKLPMGTYRVSRAGGDELLIRSRDGAPSVLVITSGPSYDQSAAGRLVFNRYGNQYFLHEVLCNYAAMHAEIGASRLEKEVRIQQARLQSGTESVAVLQMPEQR